LDSDSGLTIFRNPDSLKRIYRNKAFNIYNKIYADSGFIVFNSPDSGLQVYNYFNSIPDKKLYSFKPDFSFNSIFYFEHNLFLSNDNVIKIYHLTGDDIYFVRELKIPQSIFLWKVTDGSLVISDESGNIFDINSDLAGELKKVGNPGFNSSSVAILGDTLLTSYVKRSRLLSIWDPYLPSNYVRLALWKAGWEMFLDHPLFGVGDIDLGNLYRQYKSKYEKEIQGHMHNNFVHILVTLGIFGLFAFIYLLYRLFKIDLDIYNNMKSIPFASSYALGTFAALSTIIIAGLTEMNFFDHEITTLLWFTFGLNAAIYKLYKKNIS